MNISKRYGTLWVSGQCHHIVFEATPEGGRIFSSEGHFEEWIAEEVGTLKLVKGHSIPVSFNGSRATADSIDFKLV